MARIEFRENGPMVIETGGRYVYTSDAGPEIIEKPRVSLCRCGGSAKKPFCDGSHRHNGFVAPAAVIEFDESAIAQP